MDILNTLGKVIFTSAVATIKDLVIEAVKSKADLRKADLRGANLREADLRGADLRGADLYGADLYEADLYGANLYEANLRGADLRKADLRGADLYGANLYEADLRGADLRGADLYGANLYEADLYEANLYEANLRGADLRGAKNAELVIARLQFIPTEGAFVGWKKCHGNVLVKLLIPEDAKRSHGRERKCRASKVQVLEVIGAEVGISMHDGSTEYMAGGTVEASSFEENRWEVCAPGIHFFLTREEAQDYNL